ncbi:hypothetical protein GCM10010435_43260 [Winogradskya consettensis]|uniref:Uncharacterized protein n=1 Tax=Winogradskya consettensis TaxID=113560 RepID=A0A919VWW8_9ACTN|nr:hypothetical protein [Actinoplanes consettensis]GIM83455.1 hypothetical protein Aco04nite_86600 [Actinoplanes consettensis]
MKRAVITGFFLALFVSGAAYGHWSSTGTGSGTATSGTATALTLTPGTPTALLYPGSSADVAVTIANPNTFAVRVMRIYLDPAQGTNGYSVDAPHNACGVGAITYTTQTNSGNGWTVAANGSLALSLTGALSMAASAANTCQGATFRVYLGTSGTGP